MPLLLEAQADLFFVNVSLRFVLKAVWGIRREETLLATNLLKNLLSKLLPSITKWKHNNRSAFNRSQFNKFCDTSNSISNKNCFSGPCRASTLSANHKKQKFWAKLQHMPNQQKNQGNFQAADKWLQLSTKQSKPNTASSLFWDINKIGR